LKSYDAGTQVDIEILDFSKAFDAVPHDKLPYKLDRYGIKGSLHAWLTSFLTRRHMRVVFEGVSSEETPVISGVPHGTVPLLFLCHINDLPDRIRVRLFADDCLIYREIKTPQDHIILQQDLCSLESCARSWGYAFQRQEMLHTQHEKQIPAPLQSG